MKNFREMVKREMEREGWMVTYIAQSPLDLKCERNKEFKLIRAHGNGHGHIYKDTIKEIKEFKKKHNVSILIAKVNGDNQIIFRRFEKLSKQVI